MIHFSRLTPRRQTAILGIVRLLSVLVVGFILLVVGYYLYVNVINRAPAEVAVAYRDTAIASKYGTVIVSSLGVQTLFAQNAGYLQTAPGLDNDKKAQGIIVHKGQLLGAIHDETIERQVHDAQLLYDTALQRQKGGPPSQSALNTAQDRLNRLEGLQGGNIAKAELLGAQSAVTGLATQVDNEKLALQQGVDQAGSVLNAAKQQLSRTELRAPFEGVLTGAFFLDHSYVSPNQPVFIVSMIETILVGQVNEEDVGPLQNGMKADVQLYSYPNVTYKATLDQILPSPDANSSRYTVTLAFDQKPPEDIKFGMTGYMNIILGRRENALLIPASALVGNDLGTSQVLIVENGVVELRTVKIGFKSMELAQVTEGIKEGTQVIRANQDLFRPGDRVRPFKGDDPRKGKH